MRVKSNGHKAAAVDGIDGQPIQESLKDPLRKLAIPDFRYRTSCKSLPCGGFSPLLPESPPPRGVEFRESFQAELANRVARQAVTGKDAVLCSQVCIGHGIELIEFLDGRDVRILLLNLQQYLSPVDGPLLECRDKDGGKQDEKDD